MHQPFPPILPPCCDPDGSVAPAGTLPLDLAGALHSETTGATMTPPAVPAAPGATVSKRREPQASLLDDPANLSGPAPTGGMRPAGSISPVDGLPPWADAIEAVRRKQRERGHTPEADDALDLFDFSKRGGRLLHRQNESASLHRLEATQRDAIKLAAFSIALAESCQRRLDALSGAADD